MEVSDTDEYVPEAGMLDWHLYPDLSKMCPSQIKISVRLMGDFPFCSQCSTYVNSIHTITLLGRYDYYSHLTNKETESKEVKVLVQGHAAISGAAGI